MSKGVHVSSGCARYRSVYVCITVKGSRVCGHCNVLAVRKYVRASMVKGDNGPHFIAEVIRELFHLIGVSHTLTLAYSKQENAIVERYNKEINRHLRSKIYL